MAKRMNNWQKTTCRQPLELLKDMDHDQVDLV